MRIRLHPATKHGDRLHLFARYDPTDPRLGYTVCLIRFAWGFVPKGDKKLPLCVECWS